MQMNDSPIVRPCEKTERLCKAYRIGTVLQPVLHEVDLSVHAGEFLSVTGASGSGKSTLLHILGLLDAGDSGRVWINAQPVKSLSNRRANTLRRDEIGFVFQFYHLLPELTVLENVMLPAMVGVQSVPVAGPSFRPCVPAPATCWTRWVWGSTITPARPH